MRGEGRDRGQGCCKSILSAREKASQKRNPSKQIQLPTIGPCFATVLCKSKAGELLPEKTRVVKRLKEINLSLEYYLTRREINVGPQCFPSFPPPHSPPELSIPIHHGSLEENRVSSQQLFRMHFGPEWICSLISVLLGNKGSGVLES